MISSLGLVFAFISAITFAAYGLVSRVLVKENDDPLAFSVVYQTYASIFALTIIFIEPWSFGSITPWILLLTFLATVFYGIFQGLEFFARKHLEASRLSIFFQLTPAITFIGALLFLGEGFSIEKLAAIILIIAGNVIALYKHGGQVTKIGLLFGMITVISLALAYIADKKVFEFYPLGFYVVISYAIPAFYASLFLKDKIKRIKKQVIKNTWKLPVLSLVNIVGYYLLLKTFQLTEASIAVPIIYISTILTVIGSIIILKEKSSIPQKVIGAVLVFIGVVLLG